MEWETITMEMLIKIFRCLPSPLRRFFRKALRAFQGGESAYWADALNFGDLLTPALMKSYGINLKYTPLSKTNNETLVGSGSIFGWLPNTFSGFIIGTGLMNENEAKEMPNAKILAVRGKLTRRAYKLSETVILGDPGLLAFRLLANRKYTKRWRLGIIPHQLDIMGARFKLICNFLRNNHSKEICVISPRNVPSKVIEEISKCENVISSSLHGIIVADALGVPNARIKFDTEIGDFKFDDYYSSVNRNNVTYDITDMLLTEIIGKCELADQRIVKQRQAELDSCFRTYIDVIRYARNH